MMKTLLAAALLLGSLASNAADVSGEWFVEGSFDAASVARGARERADLVCTFAQRGGALSGTCRPPSGPDGVPAAGSVRGPDVEWRFDIALAADRKKETVVYRGRLDDDGTRIRGTFRIGGMGGRFSAERW